MKHLSAFLLLALVAKQVILPPSIADAIALTALAALHGWMSFLQDKKGVAVNQVIIAQVASLKHDIDELNNKVGVIALRNGLRK